MDAKINIAKILKDKPVNTKLYSPFYGNCILAFPEDMTIKDTSLVNRYFYDDGRGCLNGEIMLFPSKEMQDWRKFAWKKGDLLINSCGFQCIFKEWASNDYTKFNGCYSNSRDGYEDVLNAETAKFDKLDNNTVYGYIREIERKLGGKLNRETLKIEKAQSFKDWDVITIMPQIGDKLIYLFKAEDDEKYYGHAFLDGNIAIVNEDSYCQKDFSTALPSTEEEKQRLFNGLAKKNKAWDSEKKAIVDLKPKWTPKPFDRVITRVDDDAIWTANIFSHINQHGEYVTIGGVGGYPYCIPYNEETAHLLGTTNEWKGGEG